MGSGFSHGGGRSALGSIWRGARKVAGNLGDWGVPFAGAINKGMGLAEGGVDLLKNTGVIPTGNAGPQGFGQSRPQGMGNSILGTTRAMLQNPQLRQMANTGVNLFRSEAGSMPRFSTFDYKPVQQRIMGTANNIRKRVYGQMGDIAPMSGFAKRMRNYIL